MPGDEAAAKAAIPEVANVPSTDENNHEAAASLREAEAAEAPTLSSQVIYPGLPVRLKGLTEQTELNGRVGWVTRENYDVSRWTVTLGDGHKRRVKPDNLDLLDIDSREVTEMQAGVAAGEEVPRDVTKFRPKPQHATLESYEGQKMVVPLGYKIRRAYYGSPYGYEEWPRPWKSSHGYEIGPAVVEQLAESQDRSLLASNELFGDPLIFRYKVLMLELSSNPEDESAQMPLRSRTIVAAEGETLQIPQGKTITRAFYGDPNAHWDTERGYDVTEAVKKLAAESAGDVAANNDLFGDPLMFRPKELVVEVEDAGTDELLHRLSGVTTGGTVVDQEDIDKAVAAAGRQHTDTCDNHNAMGVEERIRTETVASAGALPPSWDNRESEAWGAGRTTARETERQSDADEVKDGKVPSLIF